MKKIVSVILGIVLTCSVGAAFAGCTGKNTLPTDKFNITIAIPDKESEVEIMEIWKEAYEEENPEVNISYTTFAGDSTEEYINRTATADRNSLPMMVWVSDSEAEYLSSINNFIDLRKFYEADSTTDYTQFYSSMLNVASYSGEFRPTTSYTGTYPGEKSDSEDYGIWFAPRDYNKIAIIINKDIFDELGVLVPVDDETWTWDKLAQTVQELSSKIAAGGLTTASMSAIRLCLFWEPVYTTIFKNFGGDGVLAENNGAVTCVLDSDKNKEIYYDLFNDFVNHEKALDREDTFSQNLTAMAVISRPSVLDYVGRVSNFDFLSFPMDSVGAGCSGYAIIADHAEETQTVGEETRVNQDICWDFIRFIISEEGQELGGETGFIQPIRQSLTENGAWTQAIDPELNHAAFTHGDELSLDLYTLIEPRKRTGIRSQVRSFFTQVERADSTSDIDTECRSYKNNIINLLNR